MRAFGRLDVLVNNASTFYPTPVGTITPDQFDDLVGANLRAPLFLSQAAAPALARHEGLILNIARHPRPAPARRPRRVLRCQGGPLMLTRSLARELGPAIRVNAIAPGPVMWPERGMDVALRERIVARTALKRAGTADDVAKAALYFATGAPYVTGEVLAVDGGRLVGGERPLAASRLPAVERDRRQRMRVAGRSGATSVRCARPPPGASAPAPVPRAARAPRPGSGGPACGSFLPATRPVALAVQQEVEVERTRAPFRRAGLAPAGALD